MLSYIEADNGIEFGVAAHHFVPLPAALKAVHQKKSPAVRMGIGGTITLSGSLTAEYFTQLQDAYYQEQAEAFGMVLRGKRIVTLTQQQKELCDAAYNTEYVNAPESRELLSMTCGFQKAGADTYDQGAYPRCPAALDFLSAMFAAQRAIKDDTKCFLNVARSLHEEEQMFKEHQKATS